MNLNLRKSTRQRLQRLDTSLRSLLSSYVRPRTSGRTVVVSLRPIPYFLVLSTSHPTAPHPVDPIVASWRSLSTQAAIVAPLAGQKFPTIDPGARDPRPWYPWKHLQNCTLHPAMAQESTTLAPLAAFPMGALAPLRVSMPTLVPSSFYFDTTQPEPNRATSGGDGMVRHYGPLVWKTYWGVYFGTLLAMFVGIESKLVNPLCLQHLGGSTASGEPASVATVAAKFMRDHRPLAAYADMIEVHPLAADFVVAWLLAEASEPVRIGLTAALVPVLAERTHAETAQEENSGSTIPHGPRDVIARYERYDGQQR